MSKSDTETRGVEMNAGGSPGDSHLELTAAAKRIQSDPVTTVSKSVRHAPGIEGNHQHEIPQTRAADAIPAEEGRRDKAQSVQSHGNYSQLQEPILAKKETQNRYDSEVSRLTAELAGARSLLDQRAKELESANCELKLVQALSRSLRSSANQMMQGQTGPFPAGLRGASFVLSISEYARRALCAINRKTEAEAIRKSKLFDDDWYLQRYPDVAAAGVDPLRHYLKFGAWEGRDPHPLFDTHWYQAAYPDIKTCRLTPLGHYVMIGAGIGCNPNPLFHTAWYTEQNPDFRAEEVNPLHHYMQHGTEQGRNPNPLFDSAWYLERNPDVRAANENPLCHYLRCGVAELRDPHPLFDSRWYLQQYDHVISIGMDALEHYLIAGAFEGCRPGPKLSDDAIRADRNRSTPSLSVESREIELGSEALGRRQVWSPINLQNWRMRLTVKPDTPRFTGVIGVFVHLFHEDLSEEIATKLLTIPYDYKVYVSTNSEAKKSVIEAVFRKAGIEPVIKVLPNRGWDLAALLLGFNNEIKGHEICLKVHGKKSRHAAPEFGERWRKYLFSGLLSDRTTVSYIVESFMTFPKLGVLMLPHWRKVARHAGLARANYGPMTLILNRADIALSPSTRIAFPSGSMFWFRSDALSPLLDLGLTWRDFHGCRARNYDATIAHAIERSILIFAAKAGFGWAFVPKRWRYRVWPARNMLHRGEDVFGLPSAY